MKKNVVLFFLLLFVFTACHTSTKPKPSEEQRKHRIEREQKSVASPEWIELHTLDTSFVYDIRYATTRNFVHRKMYPCAKCYVRPVVAQALLKIQQELRKRGWKLKLFDCYRPGKVQQELWKIKPDPRYVANPKTGSMHNRGIAIDVTIVDQNGKELDMGTPFDYFGKKAYHAYAKLPDTVIKNRLFLKHLMQKYDMEPITSEWWHYSYRLKKFPIANWVWKCP